MFSSRRQVVMPPSFCLVAVAMIIAAMTNETTGAESPVVQSTIIVSLDGSDWLLATDPKNVGRDEKWWEKPTAGAKAAKVPGIIQVSFPTYHGVAWYWREFTPPANPHAGGRYLLRFWQVDYLADVWLNGVHVGQHEGTGEPFVLDVTDAIKPETVNRLAVRVLNPTNEPIDGIRLPETTMWAKGIPCRPGLALNYGGIIDNVELLVTPAVRVEDLFVEPDPNTGKIRVHVNARNAGKKPVKGRFTVTVAPAAGGETLNTIQLDRELPPGDTLIETELEVEQPRLWELNDPYLYRVTVRAAAEAAASFDEQSTRCGFRDFRFEDGYFRLNGRRILLKSAQTDARAPGGTFVAHNPDLPRRDLLNCKVTGHNMIRSFGGQTPRYQLELCDEIGLLVYQEHAGAWRMEPSPKLAERFNRSVKAMVRRDRNHPCVVMWGILNETNAGPVFDQGAAALPLVRALDESRIVMLNSGSWDHSGKTIANPGAGEWQTDLADIHPYQPSAHRAAVINKLRTLSPDGKPFFHSEGGVGSALNLARLARQFEQMGGASYEDATVCRGFLNQFMADWKRWKMDEAFANPDDYFRQCIAWMAPVRKLEANALRANPKLVAYNITGLVDPSTTGEGMLATTFRELKPGIVDAMFDALAPLRWCLFVEPVQVYRGRKTKLEAVLANEDVLAPGQYPARLQVVGPNNTSVFDRTITVTIPDPKAKPEPAFALPVFAEEVVIDGPSGKYRFLATFQKGAAAAGGDIEFYVADPADIPKVETEVVVWGDDPELAKWLSANGIKNRPFAPGAQSAREVILAGNRPAPGEGKAFAELARHIARGSHAIFLLPEIFMQGDNRTRWLPLVKKGSRPELPVWLYHKDDWAKNHPIFEGLPAGCVLDHTFYREIFGGSAWSGQDVPAEVVAGSINTCLGYNSGVSIGVYNLGAGRFTINALHLRQNLGTDPVAERLVRNMLRYAARDTKKPLANLPADFDAQLGAMGYQ